MTVYAAGALCWTHEAGKIRVLIIHRKLRNDFSLPKGKVDLGETLLETAVREVYEETGFTVALGVPLGITSYTMTNKRAKVVYYWAAEVSRKQRETAEFIPNDEVDGFEWLSLRKAKKILSYSRDIEVIERFQMLLDQGITSTFAVIALRHAKTIPPAEFSGSDAQRPLTRRGKNEAHVIVAPLRAFGLKTIISSTAKRCLETVAPLAEAAGIKVHPSALISQEAFEDGSSDVRQVVAHRVQKRRNILICSHGPVLPEIIREVELAAGGTRQASLSRAGELPVAGFSVIHLSKEKPGSGIVAIETHKPPAVQ